MNPTPPQPVVLDVPSQGTGSSLVKDTITEMSGDVRALQDRLAPRPLGIVDDADATIALFEVPEMFRTEAKEVTENRFINRIMGNDDADFLSVGIGLDNGIPSGFSPLPDLV